MKVLGLTKVNLGKGDFWIREIKLEDGSIVDQQYIPTLRERIAYEWAAFCFNWNVLYVDQIWITYIIIAAGTIGIYTVLQ